MTSDIAAVGHALPAANATSGQIAPFAYPALYKAADAASLAGQQGNKWLVIADLGLLAAAAAFSLAGQFLPPFDERWTRTIAATLLVVSFIAKAVNRQRGFDAQWFNGRALAETVKSASWRYAMHAPPFAEREGAKSAFAKTLRQALQAQSSLMPHLHNVSSDARQIPPALEEIRSSPLAARRHLYLSDRLATQTHWYASKAEANARSASRWFWVGIAAQGAAMVVAILLIVAPDTPDVMAALTTIAAAVAAWTQFRRHDELSKSYSLAAHELAFLRAEVEDAADDRDFQKAVDDTESAISREHTMWMAKRG